MELRDAFFHVDEQPAYIKRIHGSLKIIHAFTLPVGLWSYL
jgi:hypothetical protein